MSKERIWYNVQTQTIINERHDLTQLARLIENYVPNRCELETIQKKKSPVIPFVPRKATKSKVKPKETIIPTSTFTDVVDVEYEVVDWTGIKESLNDGIYERYTPQSVLIKGAKPHPTKLVESTAMNAIAPPKPTYVPKLPKRVITEGLLSDAQIESVIYAGNKHEQFLPDWFVYDRFLDKRKRVTQGTLGAVRYRQAWFLGDNTGVGKGRQCSGLLADNWLKGRKKGVWISKNAPLLEDARRDWQALGGNPEQVVPLSNYKQGDEISLTEGILFVTYGTLRTAANGDKISRVDQIVQWLGEDSDAVVIFDEAHSMSNAISSKGSRGTQKPSQQGLAGLRLQYILYNARFVYVSATGASKLENLCYLERLGLWNSEAFPFADRHDFLYQVEQGGLAALEVLARDMKAMGLYLARSVSFDGVEYEIVEHELSSAQENMYDKYAQAYQIIHHNIHKAIETTNATNGRAKLNAYSKFEGAKQRFFNHLITSIKCPTLIKSIEKDLEAGRSVVIQLVSTDEALLDRRLATIPTNEWKDIKVDITPREYLFDYLMNGFPVTLHETYTDENENERSRVVYDANGKPVISNEALSQRDELIEQLAFLPPLPSALDQIINFFGYENVAEITGRTKRLVRIVTNESDRTEVQTRSTNANIAETQTFMEGRKRILVFSQAGAVGRSYHSDRTCPNTSQRIHYLLQSGWSAESAIQGLGRTNRSNQEYPPIYRVITTNIKGERRFTSTISRRIQSLGAITKGERKTGGQGLFREEDNLESIYAKHGLVQLYSAIEAGNVTRFSSKRFEEVTGLHLNWQGELPPMKTFLNRVLGMTLDDQGIIFDALEFEIQKAIALAKEGGYYEVGVETLKAHQFKVLDRIKLYQDKITGGISYAVRIEKTLKNRIMTYTQAEHLCLNEGSFLAINSRSGRAAVVVNTDSSVNNEGGVSQRVHLYRPDGDEKMHKAKFIDTRWRKASPDEFQAAWENQIASLPEFRTETFYLITGLLLPIWKKLDPQRMKIYRVHLDNGEQLLGRMVAENIIATIAQSFNVEIDRTASEIYNLALNSKNPIPLTPKLSLKTSKVMGNTRLEIVGYSTQKECRHLKYLGANSEFISHEIRLFVPLTNEAISLIEKIQQSSDRFLS
ncbi:MAG: strawberry notch family protein [Cyanobacteria bacterium P01_G01_bin.49]